MQAWAVNRTCMGHKQPVSDMMQGTGRLSQCRLDNDQCAMMMESVKEHLNHEDLPLNGILCSPI